MLMMKKMMMMSTKITWIPNHRRKFKLHCQIQNSLLKYLLDESKWVSTKQQVKCTNPHKKQSIILKELSWCADSYSSIHQSSQFWVLKFYLLLFFFLPLCLSLFLQSLLWFFIKMNSNLFDIKYIWFWACLASSRKLHEPLQYRFSGLWCSTLSCEKPPSGMAQGLVSDSLISRIRRKLFDQLWRNGKH